ncbi:MAG: tetratricopeptide repeat protein [Puniceicoccaceae bacterium]
MNPFRFPKAVLVVAALAWTLPGLSVSAQDRADVGTMRLQEVLARATAEFQGGDFAEAARLFDEMEATFGREPELREPAVQRVLLPARGYAEFALGNYDRAIGFFNDFLERFPETGSIHAFVLYTVAQAHQLAEDSEAAARRLDEFAAAYPRSPESSLAVLQRADILFRSGKTDEGLALSERLHESGGSQTLRTQARLRALQVLVDEERFDEAYEMIRSTRWRVTTMPELAVLAFSALRTGDALMAGRRFDEAIRCYRLVPPYEQLIERQEAQLARAENALEYRRRTDRSPMANVWNEYYVQLANRLRGQLDALNDMGDYTPGFLLRYGQAFLRGGRPRESYILARALGADGNLPAEIREQADYLRILSSYALEDWEETLELALAFEDLHPESDLAPEAIYLVAQAYQEQRKFRPSVEAYTELLERFPEHELAARWLFTRGFNLAMLEQYEDSRADFAAFRREYPDHPLGTQAALWHALTHQFEGEYESALAELRPLAETSRDHHLYPEIRYRIATAEYGRRDYETAREEIDAFLEEFPRNSRAPEATVLRGDILMGLGELVAASSAFAQVTPEAGGLFPYAVFQRGKIFKALERYDLMIEHFSDYLERDDIEGTKPRISEALYWLGWAYLQSGRPERALEQFDQAIAEFGDDPSATEIQPILASLETMRRDLLKEDPESLPAHPVLEADSFADWLEAGIEAAEEQKRLTWLSRLKYFEATRARARGEEELARTILQEIDELVPLDQLDPEVIGQIGLVYSEAGYDYAEDYFDFILDTYPDHPARAEAWFGLAQILFEEGETEEAGDYLRRFEEQMPTHPLAARVRILRGRILTQLEHYDDAEKVFEDVLALKEARGLPHVRSLAGLAEMNEARGEEKRAIAYWQRIYTLYRAYPEEMAEAYYRSADLFNRIGEPAAAFRTLEEMLGDERLLTSAFALRAEELRESLLAEHGSFPPEDTGSGAETAEDTP